MSRKHLWEVNHAYYCNDSNYFDGDCGSYYKSFSDFIADWGDADMDYNLLFRWDWKEADSPFTGDIHYRNGKLHLYWMSQRKGLYQFSIVEVCRADEPEVIKFLKPRMKYLFDLWMPLPEPPATEAEAEHE